MNPSFWGCNSLSVSVWAYFVLKTGSRDAVVLSQMCMFTVHINLACDHSIELVLSGDGSRLCFTEACRETTSNGA